MRSRTWLRARARANIQPVPRPIRLSRDERNGLLDSVRSSKPLTRNALMPVHRPLCIRRYKRIVARFGAAVLLLLAAGQDPIFAQQAGSPKREPPARPEKTSSRRPAEKPRLDVIYVPTPQVVVDAMLDLAKVTEDDLVYDLGCGDGRVVVTAAREYGCKAVGVDIDPQRVADSLANVKANNVGELVTIRRADIFETDLRNASVVTLYLLPNLNVRLLPRLEKLKPGSRIVAHSFDIKGVKPNKVVKVPIEGKGERTIYLYVTPLEKEQPVKPAAKRPASPPPKAKVANDRPAAPRS